MIMFFWRLLKNTVPWKSYERKQQAEIQIDAGMAGWEYEVGDGFVCLLVLYQWLSLPFFACEGTFFLDSCFPPKSRPSYLQTKPAFMLYSPKENKTSATRSGLKNTANSKSENSFLILTGHQPAPQPFSLCPLLQNGVNRGFSLRSGDDGD